LKTALGFLLYTRNLINIISANAASNPVEMKSKSWPTAGSADWSCWSEGPGLASLLWQSPTTSPTSHVHPGQPHWQKPPGVVCPAIATPANGAAADGFLIVEGDNHTGAVKTQMAAIIIFFLTGFLLGGSGEVSKTPGAAF
jgi:hypothetical protein